jgi:hypothetical protein
VEVFNWMNPDIKRIMRLVASIFVGGCLGCVSAFLAIFVIGVFSGHSLQGVAIATWSAFFMVFIGLIAGGWVGLNHKEVLKSNTFILPHFNEEAARAHFNPSTPPTDPRGNPDDRIKQPDSPGPDTTDPIP